MKLTINVDLTPVEARAFFGLPDVEPLNKLVMDEMKKKAKDNLDTLADPEKLISSWMQMGGKGLEQVQGLMAAAMAGGSSAGKK